VSHAQDQRRQLGKRPRLRARAQARARPVRGYGCFGRTFYSTADEQLTRVLELCDQVDPKFVAKLAIYARTESYMKDMPALLCAWLSSRDARLHEAVFAKVIDNTRMLRNYVQILRSGVVVVSRSAPPEAPRSRMAAKPRRGLALRLEHRPKPVALRHRQDGSPQAGVGPNGALSTATCSAVRTRPLTCPY